MKRNETPLTPEQSAFAAEHEALIGRYLGLRRLNSNDFYDVAVFGYLRAVRRYLTEPALAQLKFSRVAFLAMRCEIGDAFRARRAAKRDAPVGAYVEDIHTDDLEDMVPQRLEAEESLAETEARLAQCLTRRQSKIVYLKASGCSNQEAAQVCHLRPSELKAELAQAQDNVIRFAPDLAARAA